MSGIDEKPNLEVKADSFLTKSYFENILQKFNRDEALKVHSLEILPCGATGDAFASTMYRIRINASQNGAKNARRLNFIVKMMPTLSLAREKLGTGSFDVHVKEMKMFQNIFPSLKIILKSINGDKNVFPKAIAIDRIKGVLILEDLNDKKFLMADRKIGLDLGHLKLGIKKLALMHGSSIVMMQENSKAFQGFENGMFSRKTPDFSEFITTNLNALADEISTWDGLKAYTDKLHGLKSNLIRNTQKVFDNDEGEIKTLIHGDLWVNNLMFNYSDDGSVMDCIIVSLSLKSFKFPVPTFFYLQIDFQFSCIGHPAIDLLYFLYTSSVDDIRQTKIFELTQFYYYELKRVLAGLNYDLKKLPTLHEFQLQVLKKYFYGNF